MDKEVAKQIKENIRKEKQEKKVKKSFIVLIITKRLT